MVYQCKSPSLYEEFFVPSLFQEWSLRLLEKSGIQSGATLLDIACGTGVLARTASMSDISTTGIDIDLEMLSVARSLAPRQRWFLGESDRLPFDSHSFDYAFNQFGLMFVQDKAESISEMLRVIRPGGVAGLSVWAAISETPGYFRIRELLKDLLGYEGTQQLDKAYSFGDLALIEDLLESSTGAVSWEIEKAVGIAKFESVESWLDAEFKDWIYSCGGDDVLYMDFLNQAECLIREFVRPDGRVQFDKPAYLIHITS